MSARRAPFRHRAAGAGGARFRRECLGRVMRILVAAGHSPQSIWRDCRDRSRKLKEPKKAWDPARLTYFDDLTHVLTHWHNDAGYVDRRGKPSPLPLRGPDRSLARLIEQAFPRSNPDSVVKALMRINGVRRSSDGLYRPTGRYLVLSGDDARLHCLNTFSGYLRTVADNLSGKTALFERVATNPNFPESRMPAFEQRFERRAMRFLEPTDTELASYQAKEDPNGRRVRVGVAVVLFVRPVRRRAAAGRAAPRGRNRASGQRPRTARRGGGS